MGVAHDAAPEIDRLVLSVNGGVIPKHGRRLMALARERDLDSLELLPHLGDFLRAGVLTPEVATLRVRYWPPERVLDRLDEFEAKQLIEPSSGGLAATPTMRELLEAFLAAQADVAADQWGGHDDELATAAHLAQLVGLAASDDHMVAVLHRTLPEPTNRYLVLHHRLVTLRFVRQHDHAEAWLACDLTAPTMVVMTGLWHNGEVEAPDAGLNQLVELGFATTDPPTLTAAGRDVRETIEADTNQRAQATFDALDDHRATAFLAALRSLSGTID